MICYQNKEIYNIEADYLYFIKIIKYTTRKMITAILSKIIKIAISLFTECAYNIER